jgi:hypothetical protein
MQLGVQTHFAQGWNVNYLDIIKGLGIGLIRDEMQWSAVETSPGNNVQPARFEKYMAKAAADGIEPIITSTSATRSTTRDSRPTRRMRAKPSRDTR